MSISTPRAAVLSAGSLSWAQGGPPLFSDDTEIPGSNKWETAVAVTSEIHHPGQRQFETPLLDVNYGVGDNLELNGEVAWLVSANRDQAVLSGLSDAMLLLAVGRSIHDDNTTRARVSSYVGLQASF